MTLGCAITLPTMEAHGRAIAVVLDEDSKSYCPSFASLAEAERVLARLGVPDKIIRREDKPPQCVETKPH